MTVYLAGPITGLSYDEAVQRRESVRTTLERGGFDVRDPMRGKEELEGTECLTPGGYWKVSPAVQDQAMFRRDLHDILLSDVVLVDLTASTRVSIGTMVELGYAFAHGKYIVVVMEPQNIHEHLFVAQAASVRFDTVDSAVRYLTETWNG